MAAGAQKKLTAFTDGGCTQNGKPGARAAYSAIIYEDSGAILTIGDLVAGSEYKLECSVPKSSVPECSVPECSKPECSALECSKPECSTPEYRLSTGPGAVPVSNNRGELLGIIHGLRAMIGYGRSHPGAAEYELVTDSRICAMTLLSWLPTRRAAGTVNKLKNLDLIMIAERLLSDLRALGPTTITTVHSHVRVPPAEARARFLWQGNNAADEVASRVLAAGAASTASAAGVASAVSAANSTA